MRNIVNFVLKPIIIVSAFVLFGCNPGNQSPEFQDGDIVFQTSKSTQSRAIQLATNSKYSHVGIIYKTGNEPYVFEAVQPVKITPLNEWIQHGENSHFVVKRIKNAAKILTPDVLKTMKKQGEKYLGLDYDLYFEWTDDRMYCSELIWKMYKQTAGIEIGKLSELRDFNIDEPLVKRILKRRFGDTIPFDEVVISPADIFNSDKLITVFEN